MQIKVQWKYHEHFSNFKMSNVTDTCGRQMAPNGTGTLGERNACTVRASCRIRDAVALSSAALKIN